MVRNKVRSLQGVGLSAGLWVGGVFAGLGLVGCGAMPSSSPLVVHAGAALKGRVHGGQQPIAGATIQLYAASTAGDGSAATPLLSRAVKTDAGGGFDVTGLYVCPSAGSLVYVVATGGNPGLGLGTNNAARA